MSGQNDFVVILANIRSTYNVGSVFRTADALGVSKIYLGGYTPSPDQHKEIHKTALGAETFVPWEKNWHTYKIIDKLKQEGFQLIALEQSSGSISLNEFKPAFPLALILGNEVKGVSKNILKRVDNVIEIPMQGEKESLNVSVAFGIAGYNIVNSK